MSCGAHYSPHIVPVGKQKLPVLFSIPVLHPCLQDLKELVEAPHGPAPAPFFRLVQFCHSYYLPLVFKKSLSVQTEAQIVSRTSESQLLQACWKCRVMNLIDGGVIFAVNRVNMKHA